MGHDVAENDLLCENGCADLLSSSAGNLGNTHSYSLSGKTITHRCRLYCLRVVINVGFYVCPGEVLRHY